MGSSKSDKGSSIGISDMNVTEPISAQGPLMQTLKGYECWNVNEIKDPAKYGDKMIKGKGEKP